MDEATPADVVSIVAELARPLAASGFDLVAPLQASWYNEEPHIAELPAEVSAGGFRHRFSGGGLGLRFISLVDNIRCCASRIIFGDQGMFVRRSLFFRLGGFPNVERLEDVAFCEDLVKHTRPLLLDQAVVTDSRKFVEQGVWRSLARVGAILLCVRLGRRLPDFSLRFFEDVR